MTKVDFSIWVGKPPPQHDTVRESEEEDDAGENDVENGQGDGGGEDRDDTSLHSRASSDPSQPASISDKDKTGSPGPKSWSNTNSTPNLSPSSHQPQLVDSFYVEIPQLSDESDFEHLPGYFAVQEILREVTPGRYLVRLGSGEVDLVSMDLDSDIPSTFNHLSTTLPSLV
jgi:hypothetical protein